MKKFSEKLNENNTLKNYSYKMTVNVEGNVVSSSESDAGELVDSLVDEIGATNPSIVVTNYQIDEIDELGSRELDSDLGESYYTPEKTNEDVDNSTGSMKKYVVVIVMRDVWDEPKIEIIDAVDVKNALINAAISIGFDAEEFDGEEFDGEDNVELYLSKEYQDTKFIVKEIV